MRRTLAILVVATLAVVPLACGDDDSGSTDAATGGDDTSETTTGDGGTSEPADVSDEGSSPSVAVTIVDSAFEPATIEADGGAEVTVALENTGALDHTFTIDDQEVDEELDAGATSEVVVDLPESGTLSFYCRFHRVAGMEGSFTVADSSGEGGAGEPSDAGTTTSAPSGGYGY
jgi:plastocyanin